MLYYTLAKSYYVIEMLRASYNTLTTKMNNLLTITHLENKFKDYSSYIKLHSIHLQLNCIW